MAATATYVTFLLKSHTDPIEPHQRIEWLKALFSLDIELIVCVDDFYMQILPRDQFGGKRTRFLIVKKEEFDTYKQIQAAGQLRLPTYRNPTKDTLDYMAIQNLKPELLVAALKNLRISTPYMAYIDAGITKIFREPSTLKSLETLQFHNIPLVLLPGCHPMPPVAQPAHTLSSRINWTFCGGFFVVPTQKAQALYEFHKDALQMFLNNGEIAWEVNVWTSYLPSLAAYVRWFSADHNDTMLTAIPAENCVRATSVL